jgi:hypothetical protein
MSDYLLKSAVWARMVVGAVLRKGKWRQKVRDGKEEWESARREATGSRYLYQLMRWRSGDKTVRRAARKAPCPKRQRQT